MDGNIYSLYTISKYSKLLAGQKASHSLNTAYPKRYSYKFYRIHNYIDFRGTEFLIIGLKLWFLLLDRKRSSVFKELHKYGQNIRAVHKLYQTVNSSLGKYIFFSMNNLKKSQNFIKIYKRIKK